MFEITRNNEDALEHYIYEQMAYPDGEYDFTFEGRFLIYHTTHESESTFYALDMKTNLSSQVCKASDGYYDYYNYSLMVPDILNAIKYTGDNRYREAPAPDPFVLIDTIFRVILPENGYAIREEQIQLSKSIFLGLTGKRVSLCEAEVGTGKSLAYLVAAVCAKKSLERSTAGFAPVTIATSNIELQSLLVWQEIPKLSEILLKYRIINNPLTVALRKGKDHYFCRLRHEDYLYSISKHPEKYQWAIDYLQNAKMVSGDCCDLDYLRIPNKLKRRICVNGDCAFCPYDESCKYLKFLNTVMSRSWHLDFQVTNHHLFLMSMRQKNILRDSSLVIIDEAHKLKDTAREVYGESLSVNEINAYLRFIKVKCSDPQIHDKFKQKLDLVANMNAALFIGLEELYDHEADDTIDGQIIKLPGSTIKLMQRLSKELLILDSMKEPDRGKALINGRKIADKLNNFQKTSELLLWLKYDEAGKLFLCCCPKVVGTVLTQRLWSKEKHYVLTSGTMSDGFSFDYFKNELGLNQLSRHLQFEKITDSPFDYAAHTRLYIPDDLPAPDNSEEYIEAVTDRIVELVKATNGHTAILFTSYRLLQLTYAKAESRLQDYHLFKMTRSNRGAINAFKMCSNGVIFASGSMWEGVDCVGDVLSSVIIVRLPFPKRNVAAEAKKSAIKNVPAFIAEYAVPEMLIKLRQGVGRLIRSETDTGVISILDVRAADGGPYAKRVRKTLCKYPRANSIEELRIFLESVKSPDYFSKTVESEEN